VVIVKKELRALAQRVVPLDGRSGKDYEEETALTYLRHGNVDTLQTDGYASGEN